MCRGFGSYIIIYLFFAVGRVAMLQVLPLVVRASKCQSIFNRECALLLFAPILLGRVDFDLALYLFFEYSASCRD